MNHWPKNLINKYIHYKNNVLSTFSWLEPVLTPALDIRIAKSGSNLVHSHPSHILCLMPCVKARKSFHGVLPCLVMMYHQTNLDHKSFSISEDLVETIVALTLNIAKWYFWMILWLMMMHHHTKFDWYCLGQHSLKFRTFSVTLTLNTANQPFHKTFQLMNMHCQTKLVAKKISSSEHITEIVIFHYMNQNSVTVTLTLKVETHFLHMTLWLIMMSHHAGFGYKWFSSAYHLN